MTTLLERIAAINARVAAEVTGTTSSVGWREEAKHAAPPRIEWRPTRRTSVKAAQGGPSANPIARAIVGVGQGYEVRCWGTGVPQAEALFDALVRACEVEAAGAWSLGPGDWARVGVLSCGEALEVSIVLRGHVTATAPTSVVIVSARTRTNPAAARGDGILEPGDP